LLIESVFWHKKMLSKKNERQFLGRGGKETKEKKGKTFALMATGCVVNPLSGKGGGEGEEKIFLKKKERNTSFKKEGKKKLKEEKKNPPPPKTQQNVGVVLNKKKKVTRGKKPTAADFPRRKGKEGEGGKVVQLAGPTPPGSRPAPFAGGGGRLLGGCRGGG